MLIVAKKEFTDQITSKRFISVLAIMLIFSAVSIYQGADEFIKQYKMFESGSLGEESKPSIIRIFGFFGSAGILTFGGILGLLMGFDLITREKETGSLKTLLSHPVFRDQIINGKALGAFAALCIVVALTIVIALGMLTMKGFIPTLDDLVAILKFGLITLAYLFTFFSIALFSSTIAKNSSSSLLIAFGIFLVLSIAIPMLGSFVAQAVVGSPPEIEPPMPPVSENPENLEKSPEWQEYRKKMQEYEQKMNEYYDRLRAVQELFGIFSPSTNYITLVSSLSERTFMPFQTKDVTKNVVGFVVLPIVFFAISYIKFLRMEVT
ncbi:MAG: ABC transporter permease [Archaeoglobus sp.]|nr:ABC transporter permease [Archaeoglobus sp.]